MKKLCVSLVVVQALSQVSFAAPPIANGGGLDVIPSRGYDRSTMMRELMAANRTDGLQHQLGIFNAYLEHLANRVSLTRTREVSLANGKTAVEIYFRGLRYSDLTDLHRLTENLSRLAQTTPQMREALESALSEALNSLGELVLNGDDVYTADRAIANRTVGILKRLSDFKTGIMRLEVGLTSADTSGVRGGIIAGKTLAQVVITTRGDTAAYLSNKGLSPTMDLNLSAELNSLSREASAMQLAARDSKGRIGNVERRFNKGLGVRNAGAALLLIVGTSGLWQVGNTSAGQGE